MDLDIDVDTDVEADVEAQISAQLDANLPGDELVGRYRLCFELASGGMASVYLARTQGLAGSEKIAAVKRIHPHLAKERSFIEMFLDEARIASRITHANVCSVFDSGEAGGQYYIAMEYLVGESLSRVSRTALRSADPLLLRALPGMALRIMADLSEGLHAAHELRGSNNELLGVVHRDVSPQNLFVTYDGVAKVVDFGVAMARGRLHQTTAGQIKGKHAYMPPELLCGAVLDRRADVWSLGVVLWELLALKKLFKANTEAETLMNILQAPIPRPSTQRPGIPAEIDVVVLKALSRDPDGRYPTARAFGRDLLKVQSRISGPIGLAEVADWMGRLFPGEAARKQALVDIARKLSGPVTRLAEDEGGAGNSGVSTESSAVREAAAAALTGQLPEVRPRRRLPAVAVVGVALVLAVVAGLLIATPRSSGPGQYASITTHLAPLRNAPPGSDADAAPEPRVVQAPVAPPLGEPATDAAADGDAPLPADPERPVQTASRATGFVSVATPGGWADVSRGGHRLGQTPLRAKLPVGRHVLTVRPFGKGPARTVPVTIKRDAVERVVVPLR
jgi:serine/threonine-protein kinase